MREIVDFRESDLEDLCQLPFKILPPAPALNAQARRTKTRSGPPSFLRSSSASGFQRLGGPAKPEQATRAVIVGPAAPGQDLLELIEVGQEGFILPE